YRASNQPIPPREDPADVFAMLFGQGSDNDQETPDAALERLWAQRKSVFDLTHAETNRLMQIVGAEDREKLEAHQTALRDIEARLVSRTGSGGGAVDGCAAPILQDVDLAVDAQYLEAGRLQMDLAAAAL